MSQVREWRRGQPPIRYVSPAQRACPAREEQATLPDSTTSNKDDIWSSLLRKGSSKASRSVALQNAILDSGSCMCLEADAAGAYGKAWKTAGSSRLVRTHVRRLQLTQPPRDTANACRLEYRGSACIVIPGLFGDRARAFTLKQAQQPVHCLRHLYSLLQRWTLNRISPSALPFTGRLIRSVTKARELSQKLALDYLYRCLACSHDTTPSLS